MSHVFQIIRLPSKEGNQGVTLFGSSDSLVKLFQERKAVPDSEQWSPPQVEQHVYVRVIFMMSDFYVSDVLGIWVSDDNKHWRCIFNRENGQVGLVEKPGRPKAHYLSGAPSCIKKMAQTAVERAAMRRLAKADPEDVFPKTRRGDGQ